MTNWNLGVIGFGNIAQALIGGLLKVQAVDSDKVHVCAAHYDKLCRNAEKFQVHPYQTAEEVIEGFNAVTMDDIERACELICDLDRYCAAAVTNKEIDLKQMMEKKVI